MHSLMLTFAYHSFWGGRAGRQAVFTQMPAAGPCLQSMPQRWFFCRTVALLSQHQLGGPTACKLECLVEVPGARRNALRSGWCRSTPCAMRGMLSMLAAGGLAATDPKSYKLAACRTNLEPQPVCGPFRQARAISSRRDDAVSSPIHHLAPARRLGDSEPLEWRRGCKVTAIRHSLAGTRVMARAVRSPRAQVRNL